MSSVRRSVIRLGLSGCDPAPVPNARGSQLAKEVISQPASWDPEYDD
jgi:hypothetical protein